MRKTYLFIFCFLLFVPALLRAQDTATYRDDDVFKKQVYEHVKKDLEKGLIKGMIQLKAESEKIKPLQKVSVKYKMADSKQPLATTDIYKRLEKSVFIVWKLYGRTLKNIEGISVHATAFAISENGIMVTNHHVLAQLIDTSSRLYDMDSTLFLTDVNGNIFGIDSVLSYNERSDAAIFKIKNVHNVAIHPLPFGKEAQIGSSVYLLSHPDGFPYYFSSGIVARNSVFGEPGERSPRMDVTADYAKGSSGGAFVDQYGGVIGMVSTTHSIYGSGRDNFQMVVKQTVPVRLIRDLIK